MEIKILNVTPCRDSFIPCLEIEIDFKNEENIDQLILGCKAELYLNLGANSSDSLFLTSSDFESITRVISPKDSFTHRFKFRLSPWILDQIEKQRKKDIFLSVYSNCTINRKLQDDFSFRSFETRGTWSSRMRGPDQIPQSRWLDILEKLGYSSVKIFELPVIKISPADPFTKASEYLEKAHNMFLRQNFKEVLMNCRQCHEELEKITKIHKDEIEHKLNYSYQGDPNKSRSQKYERLRTNSKQFCHMGPHTGYFVERKDAETALFSTLSVTKYLFQTIEEKINTNLIEDVERDLEIADSNKKSI